jgi:hypothetical protein
MAKKKGGICSLQAYIEELLKRGTAMLSFELQERVSSA